MGSVSVVWSAHVLCYELATTDTMALLENIVLMLLNDKANLPVMEPT